MVKTINTKIVGISFHQEAAQKVVQGQTIYLIPEPHNPHHSYAIKTMALINGKMEHIGYLKRSLAEEITTKMQAGIKYSAQTTQVSTKQNTTGINIEVKQQ